MLLQNGYTMKVNSIKNCGTNNVIQIDNFDIQLDKDCNVIPKGCVTITKPFKTANVHYTLTKPPMPALSGVTDVCSLVEGNKSATDILSSFALPSKCPVNAQKICGNGDKKINIGRYKSQLGYFAGNIKLRAEAKHDTGTSCLDVDIVLSRNRSG
ncbi:sortilin related [Holotrichia oblita]|uniref:Sortilin related n=1 Tax=Holotrichia oblita TaxID=644536 RepID=A0ACB9TB68_HOLOL|nr:sortilin related [Holotrichia oblita]